MTTLSRRLRILPLVLVLGTATVPPSLAAQGGRGRARMELERRVQARFAQLVREQLGLTEEEQGRLGLILRDFQDRRRELMRRQAMLRMTLRGRGRLSPRDSTPLLPEDEARTILEEMRSIQEAEARLFGEELERLLTVLTPSQLVRFYAMRERLAERVRGMGRGRGPGGPPGPGPPPVPRWR